MSPSTLIFVLHNNRQTSWSIDHANGGGGSWHANRRTSGQLSFEGSWIFLLNNSKELQSKGGGALCAGNAVALLVFGPVMP